ncbi:MAG TPA: hypothetical protein VFY21_11375 [Xanthobacteraceae bacterium]|nr:hypothetical protein [Xanthobacteraceae bacterium]
MRWDDSFDLFLLTFAAGVIKIVSGDAEQDPFRWKNLAPRHEIPWKKIALVIVCLEAVLILFIWTFGAGREQVQPYVGWLTPFAEIATQSLPRFKTTADKLVNLGLPGRANLIVVAGAIAYLAQIPIAALWVPPVWRRYRELPPPEGMRSRVYRWPIFYRSLYAVFAAGLLWFVVFAPEVRDSFRYNFFSYFITHDPSLLYRVVFYSTAFLQMTVVCVIALFGLPIKSPTQTIKT